METVVGVDMAKATLETVVWQHGAISALGGVPNTPAGWEILAQQVEAAGAGAAAETETVTLVLEPTGGYELGLAGWAVARGWTVVRPNPRQVRDWARSQGRRAKTDRQDAQVLAQYGAQPPHLPTWQPLPAAVSELEALLHQRDALADLLGRERTRLEQLAARPGIPVAVPASVRRLIETLEQEQAAIEQAITDHLRQYPDLAAVRTQLVSVPGVGARNVLPLLVLLSRWQSQTGGRGTAKGLVALAGLDPQPYQSGTSVARHPHISRQGDRRLRSRLYMGALGALRGHNPLRTFYDRLVGRGKAKKLAVVAAARKLLVWAWGVFHSGTPFEAARTIPSAA
ncbi:MAG TPA: IS110 family transposase [Longimicrobiales bacterium]